MSFVQESGHKPSLISTAVRKPWSEKDISKAQVLPPKDLTCNPSEQTDDGDFPDGGLRAWLIVVGVRIAHIRKPGSQLILIFY